MALDNVTMDWNMEYQGKMISPTASIAVGDIDNGMQPYHLLFGALGSCFYSTFLSIAIKKKLTFTSANIEISGAKKEEGEVRTLTYVKMVLTIKDPSNKEQLEQCARLGTRFCSIHETIRKVAQIELIVNFI